MACFIGNTNAKQNPENTNQTAWLERGGNQLETRRMESYCRGQCCIPSLEEIRTDRIDPGGPVLIEGMLSAFMIPITSANNLQMHLTIRDERVENLTR